MYVHFYISTSAVVIFIKKLKFYEMVFLLLSFGGRESFNYKVIVAFDQSFTNMFKILNA